MVGKGNLAVFESSNIFEIRVASCHSYFGDIASVINQMYQMYACVCH